MPTRQSNVSDRIIIRYRLSGGQEGEVEVVAAQLRGPLADAVYAEAIAHVISRLKLQVTNLPEIMDQLTGDYPAVSSCGLEETPPSYSRTKTQPISLQDTPAMTNTKIRVPNGATLLFLDDDRTRHREFLLSVGRCVVTQAYTAEQAVRQINQTVYDAVFLDHDLSFDDCMCDPSEPTTAPTGLTVAEHIAELPPEKRPGVVIIHSMNPPGARAMESALQRAGVTVVRLSFDRMISAVEVV